MFDNPEFQLTQKEKAYILADKAFSFGVVILCDEFIGQMFGTPKGGVLTVVGVIGKSGSNKKYGLTCSLCHEDKELFPDLFESPKGNLVKGSVPCGCSFNPKWSESQVNVIVRRLCEKENYEFLGFPEGYKNQRSKFEYICHTHGNQSVEYNNFVNMGRRCPECGTESKKDKLRNPEAENIAKELCEKEGYEYIGFPEGYKNNYSKFEYNCHTHGKQKVSYINFVNSGSRCPDCGGNKKKTLEYAENIAKELCEKSGYEFLGFPEGYTNAFSKFEYKCHTHGKQKVSYDSFVRGSRCPSCANYGYQKSKPGYLYFTFWTDPTVPYTEEQSDLLTKIGITNIGAEERTKQQSRKTNLTPDNMLVLRFEDGEVPQVLEDMTIPYRQKTDSSGYGEFISREEFGDGYTEVLGDYYGFNEVIPKIIDYIRDNNLDLEVVVGKELFDSLMKIKRHSSMWKIIQDYKDEFYREIKLVIRQALCYAIRINQGDIMQKRFVVSFRIQDSVIFGDKVLSESVWATTSDSAKKLIKEKYVGAFHLKVKEA